MWKKTDDEPDAGTTSPMTPSASGSPPPSAARPGTPRAAAVIGSSIVVKGDIDGGEDLAIHGRVEGKVRHEKNHVSVGQGGFLKGDVHGKSVHVEGEVRGNLFGSQEVILRASGVVQGNIVSPRVTLENGSRFKGSIDMEGGAADDRPGKADDRSAKASPERRDAEGPPKAAPGPEKRGDQPTAAGAS